MPATTPRQLTTEELATELQQENGKLVDAGSDALPFDHLSGRRFEILSYLLRQATASSDETVTLVKASGDRGRDVLVYRSRLLTEVIQCKNQRQPLTKPEVMREILKIFLHSHEDATLLPRDSNNGVAISLWCPAGFTEPAATFVDTWPEGWTPDAVRPLFDEVTEAYTLLQDLSWSTVRDLVLNVLPQTVRLQKRDAIDLTATVRSSVSVYRQFFAGIVVAPLDDVRVAVLDAMKDANWRILPNEDFRQILDRIQTFGDDRRFYSGSGFVFGVGGQVLADMSFEEKAAFFTSITAPIFKSSQIFTGMVNGKALAIVEEGRSKLNYSNKSFPWIVSQTLVHFALRQLGRMFTPSFLLPTMMGPEMATSDLWQTLEIKCRRIWSSFAKILAPDFIPPTRSPETESRRVTLAQTAIHGYRDAQEFEKEALEDCQRNLAQIREMVRAIEDYFPRDMLVVADARTAYEDPALVKKVAAHSAHIDRLTKQEQS